MSLSSLHLRRLVKRALADTAGTQAPDPERLAIAFNALCTRLRHRFRSVFGTTAVAALFARALHVASEDFSWIPDVIGKSDECSTEALSAVRGVEASVL